MPGEDNAALVAKFLDELWNKRNLDIIDQLTVENYVVHIPQGDLDREALKIVAEYYFKSFSLIHLSIVDQTSQDSLVVTRIQWEIALELRDQSNDQEILREIPLRGVSIDRIDNGRIAESSGTADPAYYAYNFKVLSRNSGFVNNLPAARGCPPACPPPAGFVCKGHQCVQG
jgi:hypothetical protein